MLIVLRVLWIIGGLLLLAGIISWVTKSKNSKNQEKETKINTESSSEDMEQTKSKSSLTRKLPHRDVVWLFIFGFSVIGVLTLISVKQGIKTNPNSSFVYVNRMIPCGIKVIKYRLTHGNNDFTSLIKGSLVNESGKTFKGVTINFKIYGKNGSLIDNADDFISDLSNGEKWNFSAVVFENISEISRIEFSGVDCY